MWRRLRRTTLAPRRPAVFPEQWPLVVVTGAVLLGSLALVLYALGLWW
jgi:hypothetical protein